jgi:cation/acetate symporter
MRSVTWTQVAQYIVLILAFLVPLVWIGLKQPGTVVPGLAYTSVLERVSARERQLQADPRELEVQQRWRERAEAARARLADVPAAMAEEVRQLGAELRRLRALPQTEAAARTRYEGELAEALRRARPLGGLAPQATPYARGDPQGSEEAQRAYRSERINFTALVFCLMLGTAAMPHVLVRFLTTPSAAAARRSVGWALLFIIVLYMAAPALAVLIKAEVLDGLVGQPLTQLPAWLRRWTRRDPSQVSFEDINGDGILQLGELHLSSDVIVLLAPEIARLPAVIGYLVAAGGLAAALSTADGLLLSIASAFSHDVYRGVIDPRAPAMRAVILSKALVLMMAVMAAMAASLRPESLVALVTAAFSIAASALFAPLVLGIFWRRASRWGAVAGMLAGLATCLGYMAINLPWSRELLGVGLPLAQTRWFDLEPTSAGVFGVAASFAAVLLVSRLGGDSSARSAAIVERLRQA